MRAPLRTALALAFVAAGVLHFVRPDAYARIVPPPVPPGPAVFWSGVFEVLGGLGLLSPATRRPAALGLMALLLAVWPANVHMALEARRFPDVPAWLLWLRVPLQLPLLWAVWRMARPPRAP